MIRFACAACLAAILVSPSIAAAAPLAAVPTTPEAAPPTAAGVEAWPAWRGGAAEGRADRPLPTHWSASDGIRWKTPIEGQGHSSPIVYGDRVYVTTAYAAAGGRLLEAGARVLTLALLALVGWLALQRIIAWCPQSSPPDTRTLMASSGLAFVVLVLAVIACSDDSLFDYARCNIRGWLASTAFASLCLGLAAAGATSGWLRLAFGVAAAAFALFVLRAFPSPDHAFRGGILSLRMQIALAGAALPLLVVAGVALAAWPRAPGSTARRAMMGGFAAVTLVTGALLLRHLLVFSDGAFPELPYRPRLDPWWLAVAVTPIGLTWWGHRQRTTALPVHLAVAALGAIAIALVVVVAMEWLATRSVYLAYQLGNPRLDVQAGTAVIWATGAVFVPGSLWTLRRTARARRPAIGGRAGLGLAAVALGAVYFARVNYVSAEPTLVRAIVCLDRATGAVRWTLAGLESPRLPIDGRNTPATPTPATDGRIVCGYFGTAGLLCAHADGRFAWSRNDFGPESFYGAAFSLLLVDGLVVVANDTPHGTALVHALDAGTGATRWSRQFPTTPTTTGNNRTPIVRQVNGEPHLIMWGLSYVTAVALRSGAPAWQHGTRSGGDLVSSPVGTTDRLFLSDLTGTSALDVDRLATGREPVRWTSPARSNCVSPVLANGMLFTVSDAGIATALRIETGERLWRHRLPGQYFSSLVASPDAVYFTNSDGVTTVVAAEPSYREIGTNDLGEPTMASMAAAGGDLYIRTAAHLYAVDGRVGPAREAALR